MKDDDNPITDNLKTIGVFRIPRKMLNEYSIFFLVMVSFFLGLFLFGLFQLYFTCKPKNEDCTYYQCVSHNEPRPTRRK